MGAGAFFDHDFQFKLGTFLDFAHVRENVSVL